MDLQLLSKENREEFIKDNKNFIYNIASQLYQKELEWPDGEELSIAIIAFKVACNNYSLKKGDFYRHAEVLIRNSFLYYLMEYCHEYDLLFDEELEEDINLTEEQENIESMQMSREIGLFVTELEKFGIDIAVLTKGCPTNTDLRNRLLNYAFRCLGEELVLKYIKEGKRPSVRFLAFTLKEDKSFVRKWFPYLWALIILLLGDQYIHIKSYLNIKIGVSKDEKRDRVSK